MLGNDKLETDVIRIIASIIDAGTLQCNTVLIGSLIGSSQSASQLDGQNSARQIDLINKPLPDTDFCSSHSIERRDDQDYPSN